MHLKNGTYPWEKYDSDMEPKSLIKNVILNPQDEFIAQYSSYLFYLLYAHTNLLSNMDSLLSSFKYGITFIETWLTSMTPSYKSLMCHKYS